MKTKMDTETPVMTKESVVGMRTLCNEMFSSISETLKKLPE